MRILRKYLNRRRYRNIYEGIEAEHVQVEVNTAFTDDEKEQHKNKKPAIMHYTISKENTELVETLLAIPGVQLNTVTARIYPQGIVTGHLLGYVQNITAEELTDRYGKHYNMQSVIGKAGLESSLEDILRSQDGYTINLVDQDGNIVSEVYRQLEDEKGCAGSNGFLLPIQEIN